MDLINGINLYSMQSAKIRKELKTTMGAAEQTEVVKHSTKTETKELPAKDVLGFMANQSVSMKIDVKQTLKVGKFVDCDRYQRISNMMKEFETEVENGLSTFSSEFPNLNVSEDTKMNLVLNSLERRIM